ncbi:MAG: hypothetical protein ACLQBA_20015 [Candidatus Binataceae bacterium]
MLEVQEAKRWEQLPRPLEHVADAIRSSRELLSMKDGEGQALCSAETWERAMNFLAEQALWLLNKRDRVIQTPDIWSGPHQSIDLHWETPSSELLINIRADAEQPAGFYGDDKGKLRIKGTLDLVRFNEGLLLWLEKTGDSVA